MGGLAARDQVDQGRHRLHPRDRPGGRELPVAVPARHPDRDGHRRRRPGHRHPAGAHQAVRGRARPGLRGDPAPHRERERRMSPRHAARLVLRLALLGLVLSVLQVAAVSQLTVFGANADLLPLAVAAVGPAVRLDDRRDLRLRRRAVRRHGARPDDRRSPRWSTSWPATGAGRLRELRDPQAALVPMAVGRRRDGGRDGRLQRAAVPARGRRPDQPAAAAPGARRRSSSTRSSPTRSTPSRAASCSRRCPTTRGAGAGAPTRRAACPR